MLTAQGEVSRPMQRPWIPARLNAIAGKRAFGWTCVALVVAPTVVLAVLASLPGNPFAGAVPAGAGAPPALADAARTLGLDHLGPLRTPELAYGLIAVACVAFLGALLASREGGVSTRAVLGWSIVVIAATTVGPPLFSHDLYLYALYGRLWALHHANPYTQTASIAPHDPFFPFTPWVHQRSVYGPVFTLISGAVVWVLRSPAAVVAAFKVLSGACWVVTVMLAARLGRRWGPRGACFAVVVIGLNPVVIFRLVAGGHNDALVALCVIAALTAWYDSRYLLVTLLLTLGMLVKFAAVIPLLLFVVAAIRKQCTVRDRVETLGKHLAVIAGLTVAAMLPFGYNSRVLSSFVTVTDFSGGSLRPPEVTVAARSASLFRHLGLAQHIALSKDLIEGLFLAVALFALLVLLRDEVRPVTDRVVLALLLFLLCSRYLEPWYLAWFIPLVGFVTKRMIVAVAIALSLLASESLLTQDTTGPVLHSLARLSYDVYPVLALLFLVALFVEVVRPRRLKLKLAAM